MICSKCHHTDVAHTDLKDIKNPFNRGICNIPECTCKSYASAISKIDEELL